MEFLRVTLLSQCKLINSFHFKIVNCSRKRLRQKISPKSILNTYCDHKKIPRPQYSALKRELDNRFEGHIEVDGKKYVSKVSQPNMKMAEQVAALTAIIGLELRHLLPGDWEE